MLTSTVLAVAQVRTFSVRAKECASVWAQANRTTSVTVVRSMLA
jgi:hypothetical protein